MVSKQSKITSFFQRKPTEPKSETTKPEISSGEKPKNKSAKARELDDDEEIIISLSSSDEDSTTTPYSFHETPAKRKKSSSSQPSDNNDHSDDDNDDDNQVNAASQKSNEKVEDGIIGMKVRTPIRHCG